MRNLGRTGFSLLIFVSCAKPKPNKLKPVLLGPQKGGAR